MALRPRDFKSLASTSFAIRAGIMVPQCPRKQKSRPEPGFMHLQLEAEVGIEPAYADLQSAA